MSRKCREKAVYRAESNNNRKVRENIEKFTYKNWPNFSKCYFVMLLLDFFDLIRFVLNFKQI